MDPRRGQLKSVYVAVQHKPLGHIVASFLMAVMLTACAAENRGPKPGLASVPPRPHLTYDVEQKREIVEGLIRDRDNARHTAGAIRAYEALGEGDTAPLPQPEPVEFPQTASGPEDVPVQVARTVESHSQNENIEEFLEELQRAAGADWDTRPITEQTEESEESRRLASGGAHLQPGTALLVTPSNAPDDEQLASRDAGNDEAVFDVGIQSIALSGTPLLRVDFSDRQFDLSDEAGRRIDKIGKAWLRNEVGLRILGDSVDVDLALIRASIVAERLVELGIDPARIDIGVTRERLGNNAWLFDTSVIDPDTGQAPAG